MYVHPIFTVEAGVYVRLREICTTLAAAAAATRIKTALGLWRGGVLSGAADALTNEAAAR